SEQLSEADENNFEVEGISPERAQQIIVAARNHVIEKRRQEAARAEAEAEAERARAAAAAEAAIEAAAQAAAAPNQDDAPATEPVVNAEGKP
ncbi:MAG TPA: hypothetical protein VNF29_07650, partial [Candidatus Binataceae bacterium]|nr:hypothetical protein [Candidatus Binataceae bacterium]